MAKIALAPSLDKGFLLFPELTNVARAAPRRVFLAHGPSPEWEKMHTFLAHDGEIFVETFDADDVEQGLESSSSRIAQRIEQCGFAVCLLVDDKGDSEATAANQQVLQYAGVFQGRYGFERVALVVEEGCEVLSNVAGLIRLEYPRGDIDRVFWRLEQMLRREGLIVGNLPHESTST
jgi:predicted nucleotide-binding protein